MKARTKDQVYAIETIMYMTELLEQFVNSMYLVKGMDKTKIDQANQQLIEAYYQLAVAIVGAEE